MDPLYSDRIAPFSRVLKETDHLKTGWKVEENDDRLFLRDRIENACLGQMEF